MAGLLLSLGGIASIVTRLLAGWTADRYGFPPLLGAAGMLGLGGLGLLGMSFVSNPSWYLIAATVTFIGGWGWNGLLFVAVVSRFSSTPGRASGIVLAGGALGAGVGP